MDTLSLRQYLQRRGANSKAGIRHLLKEASTESLRHLLTSLNFVLNIINGDQLLPRLKRDLYMAQQEINVSMFLFFNDQVGKEIADILITKASNYEHPVQVRVLLDVLKTRAGHPTSIDDTLGLVARMRQGGVEVLDTGIDYDRVVTTGNTKFANNQTDIRNTVSLDVAINDHRKIITIDGTIAYCGSANIGAEYLYELPYDPSKREKGKWHDGLVRFIAPIVPQLDEVFRERWVLDGGQDYQPLSFNPIHPASLDGYALSDFRIVTVQPSSRPNQIQDLFLQMINDAQNSIFIENPYLYHPKIVDALVAAKQRNPGLRVDLMLPDENLNDSPLSADAQRFCYQRYLPIGINVFEYQNHFNHLKIATFDERYAIVGSANLNYRSLENDRDFELVVLVDSPGFAQDINVNVRDVDIVQSRQFKTEEVRGFGSDLWIINCRNPATLILEKSREL
jgi:cardiolipin synthase A/B